MRQPKERGVVGSVIALIVALGFLVALVAHFVFLPALNLIGG